MCGIAGTIRVGDRSIVEQMTAAMVYRGPDDSGIYEDGDVCLGHRRLSILDLSEAGRQPMASEDDALVITYNGEIYNFRELRSELEHKGYGFRTETDTEVILAAYQEYGPACLERLEGMFAFGLWDRRRRQLLLARDRMGIKPLFYVQHGEGIAFASELKPLLFLPGLERRVNRRALSSTLRSGSNNESESLLASVFKLLPGHRMIWRDGTGEIEPYWRPPNPTPERWDEEALSAELLRRLRRVVQAQMVSDVPLGAALSGGLDSSGVVALMAEAASGPVRTFTVGHGEDDPDLLHARRVAEHCRTDHHETLIEADDVARLLPRTVWHLEELTGVIPSIQMYTNYREAARFVKVLLIGEGADECFAGYPRYRFLNPRVPVPLPLMKDLYQQACQWREADDRPRTVAGRLLARGAWGSLPASPLSDPVPRGAPLLAEVKRRQHALGWALHHDRRTSLTNVCLKRADATGMAHSVEMRVPFVEREIVELVPRIPNSLLLNGKKDKYILRRALAPLLPPDIAWRAKRGIQMQLNRGMVETLDFLCEQLLRPEDVRARGFFDPDRLEAVWRRRPGPRQRRKLHSLWAAWVWRLVFCEVWARIFLDRPPSVNPPATLADIL